MINPADIDRWRKWLDMHPHLDIEGAERDEEAGDFLEQIIVALPDLLAGYLASDQTDALETDIVGAVTEMVESEVGRLDAKDRIKELEERLSVQHPAVQLTWRNWSRMCEHADVGKLIDGKPEGGYVDKDGEITEDTNGRLALCIPTKNGLVVAQEDDWIIRTEDGLRVCREV
jgi:hypothetical protein